MTPARLQRIERAEAALRALGVQGDVRVRDFGMTGRVELRGDELAVWSAPAARERLEHAVRAAGFDEVELDPRGFRSGALNVLAGIAGGT